MLFNIKKLTEYWKDIMHPSDGDSITDKNGLYFLLKICDMYEVSG